MVSDLVWLLGTAAFLAVLSALFGFQFTSGFAIGALMALVFAMYEAGRKAEETKEADAPQNPRPPA